VLILATPTLAVNAPETRAAVLSECWPAVEPRVVLGEAWAEVAFARLWQRQRRPGDLAVRLISLDWPGTGGQESNGHERAEADAGPTVVVETSRAAGKLRARRTISIGRGATQWMTLLDDTEIPALAGAGQTRARVERWTPKLDRLFGQADMRRLLDELKEATGLVRLADADFIIDVGYGVGNRDGYEQVIEPLKRALEEVGVKHVAVGGSRKVTEELQILPLDRQIGQSGVSVNPRILVAVGISGAPQHLQYIGPKATIIAFNRDPEAPIMTLNQRQPRPRVFPVVGDLFETVPAFTAALGHRPAEALRQAPRPAAVTS
jgi:electron transfer flavoprotein alpha subunit